MEKTRIIAAGYRGSNKEYLLPIYPNHDIYKKVVTRPRLPDIFTSRSDKPVANATVNFLKGNGSSCAAKERDITGKNDIKIL